MKMLGNELKNITDLIHNFSIDELIYSYYSGELSVFLESIGEYEKSEKLAEIPHNAYLLRGLYELFGINPEITEEDIRDIY